MKQAHTVWRDTPAVPAVDRVDRALFEAEIVPDAKPVVMRGLLDDWPIVKAAAKSPGTLARYLLASPRLASPARQPVQTWFGAPAIGGRFDYLDDLSGFNHERRTVDLAE